MKEIERFKRELRGLMPGDRRCYHRGLLAVARRKPDCEAIAKLLYRLHELGYVVLYQKRDEEDVMCYWYVIKERITRERTDEADALART